jgi:hypothetical protein
VYYVPAILGAAAMLIVVVDVVMTCGAVCTPGEPVAKEAIH